MSIPWWTKGSIFETYERGIKYQFRLLINWWSKVCMRSSEYRFWSLTFLILLLVVSFTIKILEIQLLCRMTELYFDRSSIFRTDIEIMKFFLSIDQLKTESVYEIIKISVLISFILNVISGSFLKDKYIINTVIM